MLPDPTTVPGDGHTELGAVYRLLASELAAIKAKHAESGSAPVDQTEAVGGGEVRDDACVSQSPG